MTSTENVSQDGRWAWRAAVVLIAAALATVALPLAVAEADVDLGPCPQTKGTAAHPGNPVAGTWYTCDFTCVAGKHINLEVEDYFLTETGKQPGGRVHGKGLADTTSCGGGTDTECAGLGDCADTSVIEATAANAYICKGRALLGSIGTHLRVSCTATDSVKTQGVPTVSFVGSSLIVVTVLGLGVRMIKRRRLSWSH